MRQDAAEEMGRPSFADAKFGVDGADQIIVINLHC
jgi:uncharacterized protein (DUF2141 family)